MPINSSFQFQADFKEDLSDSLLEQKKKDLYR